MLDGLLSHMSYGGVAILGLVIGLVVYLVNTINTERRIRQLGGHASRPPTWVPLGLGHIWDGIQHAARDENLQFWEKTMRFGKASTVERYAAGRRFIMTADSENIKAVLATQFNDFGKGKRFNHDWHDFLGDSIFSTDHQLWHDSRQLIRPQFVKDRVSDLEIFERHVTVLSQQLRPGQSVDMKDLFFRYTLDAATDFLLGRSVDCLTDPTSTFAHDFSEIQRIQSLIARTGPLNWLVPRKKFLKHIAGLNSFVAPFIEEALSLSPEELEKRTKSDSGYTFLHAIASYTRDRTVLRDQLVAVLLAGRDTTACTLSWLFYELSRHPEVVAELRREIEDVVGLERTPTYENLKSMRYLQYTLNETLRLYPVVPYNVRVALKDTSLPRGGGPDGNSPVGVPANTPVAYSTHYLQLNRDIYPPTSATFPDPWLFAPARWANWQPRMWTYIPFNGGPRICVGQQFALTEMGYTVVRLLQRFSKIEGRMPGSAAQYGAMAEKTQHGAGAAEPAVEKPGTGNLQMRSEVVLSPASPVMVAFYE